MRTLALVVAAVLLTPPALPLDDVSMIPVEGEGAKYWPRWRGPSGQGLAAGTGYVDKWSDSKNVKWKTKPDTPGNGSPIVWGNRIFLTTASTDGTRRGIAAYDRATGRKLWETDAPDTSTERINPKNGYASSTPNRRPPGLRVSGPAGRDGGGLRRQARVARGARPHSGESRHRRVAAPLQGPHHHFSGSYRRTSGGTSEPERTSTRTVTAADVTLDPDRRQARVRGDLVELTKQEFDILYLLASRRGIVFSRAALMAKVWGADTYVTERTVDSVVSRL